MGQSKNQTVTQQLDPQTQSMQQDIYNAARAATSSPGQGVSGWSQMGANTLGNAASAGALGFGALQGNPLAVQQLSNPFVQQVQGQLDATYGRALTNVQNSVNDAATRAGAFGGSRHGVAAGQAMGDVSKDYLSQSANLAYGGYNDAMQRAGQLAQFGFNAAPMLQNYGEYERQVALQNDPALRRLEILKSGLAGTPYGTSTTQPLQRNLGSGILGGAATGAGIGTMVGGPFGAAVGAGLGGLLGVWG